MNGRGANPLDEGQSLSGVFDEAAAYRSGKEYAELLLAAA